MLSGQIHGPKGLFRAGQGCRRGESGPGPAHQQSRVHGHPGPAHPQVHRSGRLTERCSPCDSLTHQPRTTEEVPVGEQETGADPCHEEPPPAHRPVERDHTIEQCVHGARNGHRDPAVTGTPLACRRHEPPDDRAGKHRLRRRRHAELESNKEREEHTVNVCPGRGVRPCRPKPVASATGERPSCVSGSPGSR